MTIGALAAWGLRIPVLAVGLGVVAAALTAVQWRTEPHDGAFAPFMVGGLFVSGSALLALGIVLAAAGELPLPEHLASPPPPIAGFRIGAVEVAGSAGGTLELLPLPATAAELAHLVDRFQRLEGVEPAAPLS